MGKRRLGRYLDKVGDGTGAKEANEDYSSLPEHFKYVCPNDVTHTELERMIVLIKDSGVFGGAKYGAATALSPGITVKVIRKEGNGADEDLTGGIPITDNMDWAGLCHDDNLLDFATNDQGVTVRWTFSRAGMPITLFPGEKFIVEIDGDCSGLDAHRFQIQGVEYT